jgi:hypothetical protein
MGPLAFTAAQLISFFKPAAAGIHSQQSSAAAIQMPSSVPPQRLQTAHGIDSKVPHCPWSTTCIVNRPVDHVTRPSSNEKICTSKGSRSISSELKVKDIDIAESCVRIPPI